MAARRLAASAVSFWTWAAAPKAVVGGKAKPAGSINGQGWPITPPVKTETGARVLLMSCPNCELQNLALHLAFCSGVGQRKVQRFFTGAGAGAGAATAAGTVAGTAAAGTGAAAMAACAQTDEGVPAQRIRIRPDSLCRFFMFSISSFRESATEPAYKRYAFRSRQFLADGSTNRRTAGKCRPFVYF